MKLNATVGFYGKLPILGDFISRGLPQEFITPWDQWQQGALLTSREQLGSAWLDCYLTSPIWRFILSPGLCGDSAWAGIIMPSVDKVGRYFPLTVAMPFEQSPYLAHLFSLGDEWFKQLESVALSGLESNITVAAFEQLIQNIRGFSLAEVGDKPEQIAEVFIGLDNYLSGCNSGYSLWTTADAKEKQIKLQVYGKLPPIGIFSSFLSGDELSMQSDTEFVGNRSDVDTADYNSNAASSQLNPNNQNAFASRAWQSWAITDTGKRRKRNEDAVLNRPELGMWVVADGMGGHEAGDVASQLIVDTLQKLSPAAVLETTINQVHNCLQRVNAQLCTLARQKTGDFIIGSTVVVLLAQSNRCAFLWAGDSRLYRLRANQLQQLTRDHCPDAVETNTDVWSVKNANEITRAVGADNELELDCEMSDIFAGDIFLLCSDGLDKELSFNEIEQLMLTQPHENIVSALFELTLQRGARDNVSIIVVAIAPNL